MKLTWLGQHCLVLESQGSLLITDPYLLDTLHRTVGEDFARLVPTQERWATLRPDLILLTHNHIDHVDPPSLEAIVTTEKSVEILAGKEAWKKVHGTLAGDHNYILMTPGTEWSSKGFHVRAIEARHSDESAVGYLVETEGLRILFSGDTLYFADHAKEIGGPIDVAAVVINGRGNNMNCRDAARYCADLNTRLAIPTHWGLFRKFAQDADTPELFAREAAKRGVPTKTLAIYETVDVKELLDT